jgi:hypothetical protein
LKASADLTQTDPIYANPAEDQSHDAGFDLAGLKTCYSTAEMAPEVAISKRRPAKCTYRSSLSRMAPTAAATLKDFGTFVFSDYALDLQKQIILR